ncbi:protein-disulfide reductase DsbD domain-containing protein [Pararhodobacter oceanensis]|nr:protein-disulfide reductase DsbD domain-containing protein [Pararhodobacter oceanensis]
MKNIVKHLATAAHRALAHLPMGQRRTSPPLPAVILASGLGLGLGLGLAAPVVAQQSGGLGAVVQADILPGWQTAQGTRMAALRLRMAPGWHTYWRVPGDAGIAPRLNWSQSQNIQSIEAIWPRPEIIDQNGLRSFGFTEELILPLRITPRDAARPMAIIGELNIGVCRDTCVPADLQVSGALRGGGAEDGRIAGALGQGAQPAERHGLQRATCRLEPTRRGARLTLRATLPPVGAQEQIIMELPGSGYWISNSRTWREGGDLVAEARIRDPERGAVGINRSAVSFTILSGSQMIEAQGCTAG